MLFFFLTFIFIFFISKLEKRWEWSNAGPIKITALAFVSDLVALNNFRF